MLAIGGGTGLANLLKGLKQYVRSERGHLRERATYPELSAVATV